MNKLMKKVFSRTVIPALLIIIQAVWLIALLLKFSSALPAIQTVLRILSLVAILFVIRSDMNPSYKIGWVLLIAMLPILVVYPFMRKYFTKGIVMGSVKG